MQQKKIKSGFTLIELLVVITIIGILSSVLLPSLISAGSKARDVKRIADFRQIQTALELFHDSYGKYPVTKGDSTWDGHWQFFSTCLETGAECGFPTPGFQPPISKVPQDPLDNPATLIDSYPTYYYGYPSGCYTGASYRLAVYLENNNSVLNRDLDGSFHSKNNGCEDSNKGYCVGVGTCDGYW